MTTAPAIAASGLRPYAAYKDSGRDCLGQIPAAWGVRQLRSLGRFTKGSGGSKRDEVRSGVPCVRYGDLYTFHEAHITNTKAYVSESHVSSYTPIRHGDVLFASSGETTDEIGRSAVNLMRCQACCGGDVIILRPVTSVDPDYLGWATSAPGAASQKAKMGRGFTIVHLYTRDLKRLVILTPSLFEQRAIARYLHNAVAALEAYVSAKMRLIELLEEQKQAVIHQAVTGQIDVRTGRPHPTYMDLGVESRRRIPSHWHVSSLRAVCELIQTGPFGSQLHQRDYVDGQVPVINPSHLKRGRVVSNRSVTVSTSKARELQRHRLQHGDVVMARRGDLGRCARIGQTESGWVCGTGSMRIRTVGTSLLPAFLVYVLGSGPGRQALEAHSVGTTMRNLSASGAAAVRIVVPPVLEQRAVVAHLSRTMKWTSGAIATVRRQIHLAQEYRSRLISDVVTGKLDVREAAKALDEDGSGGDGEQEVLLETEDRVGENLGEDQR